MKIIGIPKKTSFMKSPKMNMLKARGARKWNIWIVLRCLKAKTPWKMLIIAQENTKTEVTVMLTSLTMRMSFETWKNTSTSRSTESSQSGGGRTGKIKAWITRKLWMKSLRTIWMKSLEITRMKILKTIGMKSLETTSMKTLRTTWMRSLRTMWRTRKVKGGGI